MVVNVLFDELTQNMNIFKVRLYAFWWPFHLHLIFCQSNNSHNGGCCRSSRHRIGISPQEPTMMIHTQIAKFMGPTWGPSGSSRPQMGPMLAPWTLLSGYRFDKSIKVLEFLKGASFTSTLSVYTLTITIHPCNAFMVLTYKRVIGWLLSVSLFLGYFHNLRSFVYCSDDKTTP